jgi:hypothetical protein
MLGLCFAILSLTVLLGLCLLAGRLYRAATIHGLGGGIGLVLLLSVLRRGGLAGPFAVDSAVLLAGAFAGGLTLWLLSRRGRARPQLLIFLHATAGGLAYLLLAGFAFGR